MLMFTAILASVCMYTADAQTNPKQKPGKAPHVDTVKPATKTPAKEVKPTPKAKPDSHPVDPKKKKP